MKRIFLLCLLFVGIYTLGYSQVFHSAQTLNKGSFSVGVEPAVLIRGSSDFNLFLHGGVGIKNGLDLALKFGVGSVNYFGADLEFGLAKNISLTVGAHEFGNFGLDGTLLFNIPIKSDVLLITGIDTDIIFPKDDVDIHLWVPIGLEVYLKKNTSLIFEAEIDLLDNSYHMFGGGLSFYF